MCEEFGCLPSAAVREDPALALDVMALRSYARAKAAVDRASSDEELSQLPQAMVNKVFAVQAELLERRRRDHDS